MELTAKQIAKIVNGTVVGNPDKIVNTVSKIEDATPLSLCFLSNKKYSHFLNSTLAGIIFIDDTLSEIPEHLTIIKCSHPYVAFCQILIQYFDYNDPNSGIHPTAVIEPTAEIGKNCYIGPHAYIGNQVTIGRNSKIFANTCIYEKTTVGQNTVIYSNVSIYYHSIIGDDCIIHSGTAIGSDGFGHAPLPDGTYIKIPQIGNVVIGNKVEIGSNTVMASQVGIAGSAKVGEWCMFGGQVGVAGHIKIGDKVSVGAQSGIPGNVKPGTTLMGYPAIDPKQFARSAAVYKKLPDMYSELGKLQKEIEELKKQINK